MRVLGEVHEVLKRAVTQELGGTLEVGGELVTMALDVFGPCRGEQLAGVWGTSSDMRVTCSCSSTGTRIVVVVLMERLFSETGEGPDCNTVTRSGKGGGPAGFELKGSGVRTSRCSGRPREVEEGSWAGWPSVSTAKHAVEATRDTPLLYVLRNELQLHGPRFGCGLAQCGACTVQIDGEPIRSCVTPVATSRAPITTLEGLGTEEKPRPGAGGVHRRSRPRSAATARTA